jgi:5-formyltetrahydrofolate cyclo-ligase
VSHHSGTSIQARKGALRDQLLAARRGLSVLQIGEHARAVAALLLATPELRDAATVAAYVSVGREPGTGLLLDTLTAAGRHVLLPVLLPDGDLEWARHRGTHVPGPLGLLEPDGERLGLDAVARADVVLVPGLAVGADGTRMGRGGGSYDRALGRVPAGTFTCCLLHPGELLDEVPAEPHDRRVGAAATPAGLTRF